MKAVIDLGNFVYAITKGITSDIARFCGPRIIEGEREYGATAYARPLVDLLRETKEEAADGINWSMFTHYQAIEQNDQPVMRKAALAALLFYAAWQILEDR